MYQDKIMRRTTWGGTRNNPDSPIANFICTPEFIEGSMQVVALGVVAFRGEMVGVLIACEHIMTEL